MTLNAASCLGHLAMLKILQVMMKKNGKRNQIHLANFSKITIQNGSLFVQGLKKMPKDSFFTRVNPLLKIRVHLLKWQLVMAARCLWVLMLKMLNAQDD